MQTISFNGGLRFKTDCRLKAAQRGEGARQSLLAFNDFLGGLEASGFEEGLREELRMILELVLETVEKKGGVAEPKEKQSRVAKVLTSPHRHIRSLSSAVTVAHRPKVGRHLVASRDIHEGEVVAMESAAASRLLPLDSLASSRSPFFFFFFFLSFFPHQGAVTAWLKSKSPFPVSPAWPLSFVHGIVVQQVCLFVCSSVCLCVCLFVCVCLPFQISFLFFHPQLRRPPSVAGEREVKMWF